MSLWIIMVFPWPETFAKVFLSKSSGLALGPNLKLQHPQCSFPVEQIWKSYE